MTMEKLGTDRRQPLSLDEMVLEDDRDLQKEREMYELQYKCQLFSDFSIENAERTENFL